MIAQESTTARTARVSPSPRMMARASTSALPVSSMSLPKIAPSRNSGKYFMMKSAAAPMKTWV